MVERKATMYRALASFVLVALSGLAGSFILRTGSTNPDWDPGPISPYLVAGLVPGVPAGLFAGLTVTRWDNTFERVCNILLCAAGAAFMAFFIMGLAASGG